MDEELRQAIIDNVMHIWVQPEIDRRVTAGTLSSDFRLDRAQVVMNVGQQPLIRLNDEVRIRYELTVERTGPQDPVTRETPALFDLRFDLPPHEDANAGWIFIINLYGTWQPYFDFRYNASRAREHALAAREYLNSAAADLAEPRLRPFVENMWSAAELMTKALLLLQPDEEVLSQRDHLSRRRKLKEHVDSIGRHHELLDLLEELNALRKPARYLESELKLSVEAAQGILRSGEAVYEACVALLPERSALRELPE